MLKKYDKTLIEAYKSTTYRAYIENTTIDIKVSEFNNLLDSILEKYKASNWVFITSYNPKSQKLSELENMERLDLLKSDLNVYTFFSGDGIPANNKWEIEKSLLVLDIEDIKVSELVKKYNQNAIIKGIKGGKAELEFF